MKKLFIILMLVFIGCIDNYPEKLPLKQSHDIKIENNQSQFYLEEKDKINNENFKNIQNNIKEASDFNFSLEKNNNIKDKNLTKVLLSFPQKKPLKKISKIYKVKNSHLLYINLGPIVHFDTNKYKIKKKYLAKLKNIVNELKDCNCSILVVGHTDSQGSDKYNQALSELRAREVYKYMIEQGIDKKRLDYIGYGEEQPLTTNATPEGRAVNRRVELLVSKDLNVSFSFLKNREINSSYWNNHNIKTAGKIEFTQKGWTKKLQPSQIKSILVNLKKKEREPFAIKKDKRALKIKLEKRVLYIKGE